MKYLANILSDSESAFLWGQKIPLDKVFDAQGLAKADYQERMREEGAWIACRTSPCRAAGHTLRTRAGHCAQCKPAAIAFLKRSMDSGFLYVAWSPSQGLCKIGVSKNPEQRLANLNAFSYADTDDWQLVHDQHFLTAGRLELLVHGLLREYQVDATYFKSGRLVSTREVFRCEPNAVIGLLQA